MNPRPTLAQIRGRVQKDRHREIGNWLARRVARPSAVYGTWVALRLGLSAHQVTLLSLSASLAAALAIGTGTRPGLLAGVGLPHLAFWLDHVDGQVARWRGSASLDGVYLDYLMHHAANLALGFALGHGLAVRTGAPHWSAAGFAIACGWAGLALHSDCRYKAFFQRLKKEPARLTLQGGGGGRPAPPAGWPRSGLGLLTWPAYKICEPHVVLLLLTALAALMAATPRTAFLAWKCGALAFAVLAPTLAIARVARSVRRGAVESEFRMWFPETAAPGPHTGRVRSTTPATHDA